MGLCSTPPESLTNRVLGSLLDTCQHLRSICTTTLRHRLKVLELYPRDVCYIPTRKLMATEVLYSPLDKGSEFACRLDMSVNTRP